MLIRLFKSSYTIHFAGLIFLALLFWGNALTGEEKSIIIPEKFSIFYLNLSGVLTDYSGLRKILTVIIILSEALLLDYMLINNDLIPKNSLLPALFYIILMSFIPEILDFHPVIIINFLYLIILGILFKIYNEPEAYEKIYTAGIIASLATFVDLHAMVIILFFWFVFFVYRIFNWREWLILHLGIITPYLYLFTYYFWTDRLYEMLSIYADFFNSIEFIFPAFKPDIFTYFIYGVMAMIILWTTFIFLGGIPDKIIIIRKRYWALIWFFIAGVIFLVTSRESREYQLTLLAIPITTVISYSFSVMKKLFFAEILLATLLILIFINNYLNISF